MGNFGIGQTVGDFLEVQLTPGSALNAFLLPVIDVSLFRSFSLQLSGVWSATIQVLVSNDKVNFINATVLNVNTPSGGASNISSTGVYIAPIGYRYIALQISAYTSGTVAGVIEFYTLPFPATSVLIAAGIASIGTVGLNAGTNQIGSLVTPNTTFVAAGTAANTVIKGSPGTYFGIFASTTAAGAGQVFDNAATPTGTPVGIAPTAIGYGSGQPPAPGIKCVNGIVLQGSATNPALTIFWL